MEEEESLFGGRLVVLWRLEVEVVLVIIKVEGLNKGFMNLVLLVLVFFDCLEKSIGLIFLELLVFIILEVLCLVGELERVVMVSMKFRICRIEVVVYYFVGF